jgi:MFS family permease
MRSGSWPAIGGIVFGHYGDKIGRKRLLMLSLIIMAWRPP